MTAPRKFFAPKAIPDDIRADIENAQNIKQREIEDEFNKINSSEISRLDKDNEKLSAELQKLNEARSSILQDPKNKTWYIDPEADADKIRKLREMIVNATIQISRPELLYNAKKNPKPKEPSSKSSPQYLQEARRVIYASHQIKEIDAKIVKINAEIKKIEESKAKIVAEKDNLLIQMRKDIQEKFLNKPGQPSQSQTKKL